MHRFQTIMATLLWRSAASSRSLFALPSRTSSAFSHLSSQRRAITSSRLAFQNNGAFRQPIATTFSRTLSTSTTHLKASYKSKLENAPPKTPPHKPVPLILLAGFLGSGKTSTLKHLLENNANIKIGTIVNDVASVNIDAKLISNSDSQKDGSKVLDGLGNAEGVVELQNGCACCSLADELLTSVERLTQNGQRELDAIVVELSGVADPVAVRDNWEQARQQGHPATKLANLSRTVTLIDACTFGTDWMTWDTAGERDSWTEAGDDCAAVRNVPELLAEQVEAADLLLVNKIDLAGEKQVGVASGVARGLNDKASLMEVEFGRVDVKELLGKMLEDEEKEKEDEHSSHDHSSEHDHEASSCAEPDCTDTSHSHKHSEHDHEASACTEPDCTDSSHSHSSENDHEASSCNEPDCTDSSHSHEHTSECDDADCTDTSHDHSHDRKPSTAADQLGITSFVYSSSTPFNPQRLMALLHKWPVPIKDSLDFGMDGGSNLMEAKLPEGQHHAFVGVLRSKGFCWMSPAKWSNSAGNDVWRHDTAMYWSHAGKHFGITSAGKWWGTLSKEQMQPYFANNMEEYDRIMKEDWISEEWGDRRQELVFIGTKLVEADIRAALDECLCTGEEMDVYRAQLRNYLDTTFSTAKGGPSLFDVGGSDHIDQ